IIISKQNDRPRPLSDSSELESGPGFCLLRLVNPRASAPTIDVSRQSSARRALRADVERIERLARRHEPAGAGCGAQPNHGAAYRKLDAADELAGRVVDHDAVEFLAAHAPAAPQVAVDVDAETIGRAGAGVDESAPVGELAAVDHVEHEDQPVGRGAGFHD